MRLSLVCVERRRRRGKGVWGGHVSKFTEGDAGGCRRGPGRTCLKVYVYVYKTSDLLPLAAATLGQNGLLEDNEG